MNVAQLIEVLQKVEDKSQKMVLDYDNGVLNSIHTVYTDEHGRVIVTGTRDSSDFPNQHPETEEQYRARLENERRQHEKEYRDLCQANNLPYDSQWEYDDKRMKDYLDRSVRYWNSKKEWTKNHVLLYSEDGNGNDY